MCRLSWRCKAAWPVPRRWPGCDPERGRLRGGGHRPRAQRGEPPGRLRVRQGARGGDAAQGPARAIPGVADGRRRAAPRLDRSGRGVAEGRVARLAEGREITMTLCPTAVHPRVANASDRQMKGADYG